MIRPALGMTWLTALLILPLASAAPAAQASDYVPQSENEARETFVKYTECVVKKRPKDAAEIVLSTIKNDEIIRTYPRVIIPDCIGNGQQMKLPGDFLRYGLAEALVRRELAPGLPPDIALAAPLAHRQVDDADFRPKPGTTPKPKELARIEKDKAEQRAFRMLSLYGECIDRTDPAAALRLILSATASNEETQAFAALKPALQNCLNEDQTIAFTRVSLRGTIAMNLYRLAKAPRLPTAAATR
jgi:hypothetical protein